MQPVDIEQIELNLVVEALYQRYGYDFRDYGQASLKRRLQYHLAKTQRATISTLIPDLLYNEMACQALLFDISVTVTEMFRDPWVYLAIRQKIVPLLKTYPFVNIWHAGCATGEEVYSLAILLHEEGLSERVRVYATDFNDVALQKAKARIYPLKRMKEFSQSYQLAGGKSSLADYYHASYDSVIMNESLQQNVTFANHNLATDGPFGEMHLIFCRNVLIYFNQTLQNRVLKLFRDSLCYNGFLCLGTKETLRFSEVEPDFFFFSEPDRLYQSKYQHQGGSIFNHDKL